MPEEGEKNCIGRAHRNIGQMFLFMSRKLIISNVSELNLWPERVEHFINGSIVHKNCVYFECCIEIMKQHIRHENMHLSNISTFINFQDVIILRYCS